MRHLKNISLKLLIICFMVGFGLFFGLDVAHNRLPGLKTPAAQSVSPTAAPLKELGVKVAAVQEGADLGPMTAATARRQAQEAQVKLQTTVQGETQPVIVLQDSFVNRLSNKLGDLFRGLASALLHMIVGFFKMILG
jgi:hypothetical protein